MYIIEKYLIASKAKNSSILPLVCAVTADKVL